MTPPLRHKLGATLALAAMLGGLGGLSGCYAGHGGYSGYGGYTRASTTTGATGYYRFSGGAEEFLFYSAFYAGALVVYGIVELVECLDD